VRSIRLNKNNVIELSAYALAVILCLIILIWVLRLWDADLSIPFSYSGDALMFGMYVKGIIDTGWYMQNSYIGAPWGLNLLDYPNASNLDCLLIKLISIVTHDYATTYNVFFLITFPLTTLTTMFALRQFKISLPISIVVSLLYTFIPYHFLRGEPHIFFASYFMIPLMVMVMMWVFTDDNLFFNSKNGNKLNVSSPKFIASVIICILISSTMGYYVVFSGFLLLIAGIYSATVKKKWYPALTAFVLLAILLIGLLVNIAPTLIYHITNGGNPLVASRTTAEAETYGLKIIQLFMPVIGHRVAELAAIANQYATTSPLVNENSMASLGIIGSIGFLAMIGLLFVRVYKPFDEYSKIGLPLLNGLSILNIAAVLLGTIGGFGALLTIVLPEIRCYNRISIFIAFFSLFTIAILLQIVRQRYVKTNIAKALFCIFLIIILIMGVFDQTTVFFAPSYTAIKTSYVSDQNFIDRIEAIAPNNAMIFQLPYSQFPEGVTINKLRDSDEFKGYLHSNSLRWSYGVVKGREGDLWMQNVTSQPLDIMVNDISISGFSGIYVDSYGYADGGANITADLSRLLGVNPVISGDGRLYFFDMSEYNKNLKASFTDIEWATQRNVLLGENFTVTA
jgi:hypothetical protein